VESVDPTTQATTPEKDAMMQDVEMRDTTEDDDDDDGLEIIEQPMCHPIDLKTFFKFEGTNVVQQKLNEMTVHEFVAQRALLKRQQPEACDRIEDLVD